MNSYKNKSGGAKSHMYTTDHKIKCKLKFKKNAFIANEHFSIETEVL